MASIFIHRHLFILALVITALAGISQGGKRPSKKAEEELPCGLDQSHSTMTRILGGGPAKAGEFPHQAKFENASGWHFCGGVILDQQHILTAAHCSIGRTDRVAVGSHLAGNGTRYQIAKVLKHEGLIREVWINDLALVKTTEPMELVLTDDGEGSVNRVCMPGASAEYAIGEQFIASGWGLDETGTTTSYLKKVQLEHMDDQICLQESLHNSPYPYFPGLQICAGAKVNQTNCHGDSGGPLVRLVDGAYELVGIVSRGLLVSNCYNGEPNVFTRVANYLSWIEHAKKVLE